MQISSSDSISVALFVNCLSITSPTVLSVLQPTMTTRCVLYFPSHWHVISFMLTFSLIECHLPVCQYQCPSLNATAGGSGFPGYTIIITPSSLQSVHLSVWQSGKEGKVITSKHTRSLSHTSVVRQSRVSSYRFLSVKASTSSTNITITAYYTQQNTASLSLVLLKSIE